MAVFGCLIVYLVYRDSVCLLWSFSSEKAMDVFAGFYKMAMGCITTVVLWYIGWKSGQNMTGKPDA